MTAGRPQGRDPSLITSLETAVRSVHRSGPLELAWNWRWETGMLAAASALFSFTAIFTGLTGLSVAAGAGLVAGIAALCLPSARSWLVARAWCVITPHRLRKGCANAWVHTRTGRLPIIVAATPTAYGEDVRLWLRAGLTAGDLESARGVLAAACWAAEVRVMPNARYAHLVTLEVARRLQPACGRPAPRPWPGPRYSPGDGPGDAEEPDPTPWRGARR